MNFHNACNANPHETGPPVAHRKVMKRQVALCAEHLDLLNWEDLIKIIPHANNTKKSDSEHQMTVLVQRLKDNNDVSSAKMLKLLRRLGLQMARL